MSGSQEDGCQEEEDPFWEIALNYDGSGKLDNALAAGCMAPNSNNTKK